jgi:replicative DNA helicase
MSLPAPAIVNIDAEQALLGACLLNSDALDVIDGMVSPEDFSELLHSQLFEAFLRAKTEGRRVDVGVAAAVLGDMARREVLNGLTIGQYLGRLASSTVTVLNAPDYARIISETASYRRLCVAADELKERASRGYAAGLPAELATDAIATLDALAAARSSKPTRFTVADAAREAAEASEDRALHGVQDGVTWGLHDLDRVTKLYGGDLTILAARPSMGKTTLGLSTALAAAKSGEGVLFFSLEMSARSLGQRVLSDLLYDGYNVGIPYADIRDGRLPADGAERMRLAIEMLESLPLLIEDQAGVTVSQIVARAKTGKRKLEQNFGKELGLIVIDHLGLIAAADRYAGARHLELGAMTSALKVLAKDMGVPVLLLCQLNRGVEGRDNKRPQLSDLRESGKIEEDADAVVLLYREAYYLERARETDSEKDAQRVERLRHVQNLLEINVAKQRQGATRTVEAFVSMPCNAVRNMQRGGVM